MTYEACLEKIHLRKTFSSGGPTLDRIRRLMERLGNPQNRFQVVHVAGTNGKGSTCAMLDAALRGAGKRTGLFTSPYLVDFRERIRIDGQMIGKEQLISCFETVMEQEEALERQGFEPVNEFELVTAMGFVAFAKAKVEYVVLEVGLGGRTDPTNLVERPACCCIMPISLDHTAILGNTIREIAGEKAGIIKPGCPVVVARQTSEAMEVFRKTAAEKQARLIEVRPVEPVSEELRGSRFRYGGEELQIPLLGAYQMDNAAVVWEAAKVLDLPADTVKDALKTVVWPGRLQLFPGKPQILVDAGHNLAGISTVCDTLDRLFPGKTITAVMAMMRDKDYAACIPMIARRCKTLIGTRVPLPRALEPEAVAECASRYCDTAFATTFAEAMEMARGTECDLILVCGSVYGAGAALELLRG